MKNNCNHDTSPRSIIKYGQRVLSIVTPKVLKEIKFERKVFVKVRKYPNPTFYAGI